LERSFSAPAFHVASRALSPDLSERPDGAAGAAVSLMLIVAVDVKTTVPGKRLGSKARGWGRPVVNGTQASAGMLTWPAGRSLTPSSTTALMRYWPLRTVAVFQSKRPALKGRFCTMGTFDSRLPVMTCVRIEKRLMVAASDTSGGTLHSMEVIPDAFWSWLGLVKEPRLPGVPGAPLLAKYHRR